MPAERGAVRVHAVVGEAARDDHRPLGLPEQRPVAARDLAGGVDGVGAAAAEEDRRVVERRERGERSASSSAGSFAKSPKMWCAASVRICAADRVGDLGAAVADVREPEPGGRVEVLAAVGVPDAAALAARRARARRRRPCPSPRTGCQRRVVRVMVADCAATARTSIRVTCRSDPIQVERQDGGSWPAGGGYEIVHTSPRARGRRVRAGGAGAGSQSAHADDEVYVVLEGDGELTIEGETVWAAASDRERGQPVRSLAVEGGEAFQRRPQSGDDRPRRDELAPGPVVPISPVPRAWASGLPSRSPLTPASVSTSCFAAEAPPARSAAAHRHANPTLRPRVPTGATVYKPRRPVPESPGERDRGGSGEAPTRGRGRRLRDCSTSHPRLEVGVYVLVAPEPDHQSAHADDEVYVVLEGEGELTIEGESVRLSKGQAAFVPAGADHRFTGYEGLSVCSSSSSRGAARASAAGSAPGVTTAGYWCPAIACGT